MGFFYRFFLPHTRRITNAGTSVRYRGMVPVAVNSNERPGLVSTDSGVLRFFGRTSRGYGISDPNTTEAGTTKPGTECGCFELACCSSLLYLPFLFGPTLWSREEGPTSIQSQRDHRPKKCVWYPVLLLTTCPGWVLVSSLPPPSHPPP